jgi:type I restriction enzyme R subunit
MIKAGYTKTEIASIKEKVDLYNALKDEIKLKSGDYIDLKFYEPAMRQLIDNYVRAQDSGVLLKIDNGMSLLDIVAECGADSLKGLPRGIKEKDKYIAETLIGNMRRNIVEKRPENPTYYDKLSKILNQLLLEQKEAKLSYKELIIKLIEQIKEMKNKQKNSYPKEIDTPAKQALYDKFNKNKEYVLWLYKVIKENALHGFRDLKVPTKMKRLQKAVTNVMEQSSAKYNYDVKEVVSEVMNIVINHREF